MSQIPYTTMGTGAIEVVAGLIGVSEGQTDRHSPPCQSPLASSQHHQTRGQSGPPNTICATAQPLFWRAKDLAWKWGWEMG